MPMPLTKERQHEYLEALGFRVPKKMRVEVTKAVDLLKEHGGYSHVCINAILLAAEDIKKSVLQTTQTP